MSVFCILVIISIMERQMHNVGIVGAGAIARIQVDAFSSISGCCVKGVCGRTLEKPARLIAEKGLDARPYSLMEQMIEEEHLDVISICLPPSLHAEYSIRAMRMGCHVVCEKPMAASIDQCDAMIDVASENGVLLSVISQNRFTAQYSRAREMLRSGSAGRILASEITSRWWRGEHYYDLWWRGTWEKESGGCLMSQSIHHLDLMLFLLGMPKSVDGRVMNLAHGNSECEDHAYALFDYGYFPLLFTSSLVDHGAGQRMHFDCEKASFDIPWKVYCSKALGNGFPKDDEDGRKAFESRWNALPPLEREGHAGQLSNFIRAIDGKEPLSVTGEDGRRVIEVIMGIYESSVGGRRVFFPLAKDDPFRFKEGILAAMPHFNEKTSNVDGFDTDEISLAGGI